MSNRTLHFWPTATPGPIAGHAVLSTPCYPCAFYYGPVCDDANGYTPADNATHRWHRTHAEALIAAQKDGRGQSLTVPTRTVHVLAFRPNDSGGVGGFDWFSTEADRDAAFERHRVTYAEDGATVYRFAVEVEATEREAITAEIDGQLDALCDATPAAQTYMAEPEEQAAKDDAATVAALRAELALTEKALNGYRKGFALLLEHSDDETARVHGSAELLARALVYVERYGNTSDTLKAQGVAADYSDRADVAALSHAIRNELQRSAAMAEIAALDAEIDGPPVRASRSPLHVAATEARDMLADLLHADDDGPGDRFDRNGAGIVKRLTAALEATTPDTRETLIAAIHAEIEHLAQDLTETGDDNERADLIDFRMNLLRAALDGKPAAELDAASEADGSADRANQT